MNAEKLKRAAELLRFDREHPMTDDEIAMLAAAFVAENEAFGDA